jgi:hypothetical protein
VTRAGVALARVSLVVLGLVLVIGGVAVALWSWGLANELVASPPDRIDTQPVTGLTEQAWWPWALAAAGLALIVLAVVWILAAIPRPETSTMELPGSGTDGRLSADVPAFATRAASQAAAELDSSSSSGRLVREKRQLIVDMQVSVSPEHDLARANASAERATSTLRRVLGRDDLPIRFRLVPARRSRPAARVR